LYNDDHLLSYLLTYFSSQPNYLLASVTLKKYDISCVRYQQELYIYANHV